MLQIRFGHILWSIALCFCAFPVLAQSLPPDYYVVANANSRATGKVEAQDFGDRRDLHTGAFSFEQKDILLQGTGPDISIYRTFDFNSRRLKKWPHLRDFADWDLALPEISTVVNKSLTNEWQVSGPNPNSRCSNFGPAADYGGYASDYWWQGAYLSIPGVGVQELMNRAPENVIHPTMTIGGEVKSFGIVTKGHWAVTCLNATKNGVPGEAFLAVAPDGTKYWFDWAVTRPFSDENDAYISYFARYPRVKVSFLVSRIEDRFGNFVIYSYDSDRLSWITASDGRSIQVLRGSSGYMTHYIHSLITQSGTVSAREWKYTYEGFVDSPEIPKYRLTKLTLPDNSNWVFSLAGFQNICYDNRDAPGCMYDYPLSVIGSITAPSGLVGTYRVQSRVIARSDAYTVSPPVPHTGPLEEIDPKTYSGPALVEKTLSGAGLGSKTWKYEYGYGAKSAILNPDGSLVIYDIDNAWRSALEGSILKISTYQGPYASFPSDPGSALSAVEYEYAATTNKIGLIPWVHANKYAGETAWPIKKKTISQDGVTFVWQIASDCGAGTAICLDSFSRPTKVVKSNSLGYSKTDFTAYHDNTNLWVIGQITSVINSNTGLIESQIDYNAGAQPWKIYSFGKLQQILANNPDGTLAWITDGNQHTTSFSNWKRGIPQTITFADATSKSAQVDDLGQIVSVTDENGFQTKYGYDAMGRLNLIDYPDNDDVAWNNTTVSFAPSAEAKYGLPAGHWRRVESTGNARKITFFDALWRPVVQETYDANDLGNTLSQTVTRYDANGQVVYASYPQRNMLPAVYNTWADPAQTPNALGTWTAYDALGRPTQVQQNSELGLLNTTYEYLVGFQTRVTNPRGYQTTTQYKAYDQPSTDWLTYAAQPEGVFVTIDRDVFGKPNSVSVRNADSTISAGRWYAYDQYQRLCKQTELETSTTAFGYDDAGNLTWSATGLPWSPLAPCGYTREHAYVVPRRVDRTYDARNRLATLAFPDGQGDQIWTYTPDGLPSQIIAYNDPNHTGSVVSAYQYNKRRLLNGQGETLSQPSWYSWGIGYGYDANGSLASHAYPSGYTVTYQPNALGQPTKAGTFATNVSYYPNGAIQQFTYGNGLVHTLTQNARQLPLASTDTGGALSHQYGYDNNGNVAQILDLARGSAYHRSMTYDGRDRLTGTGSCSFNAVTCWFHYDYDVLDNLTRVQGADGSDRYYCYDTRWQLTNIKTGGCNGTSVVGLGYDERGNLANKNGVQYLFDVGNRLRLVDGVEYYRYDGLGRRAYAASPTLGAIFSQYSRSGQLMYQHNGRTQKSSEYVYLNGSLVAIRETPFTPGATVVKYQHTDALGTPVAVTDSAGSVIERSEYTPYGKLFNRPLTDGPGYTGHVQDAATGMTYMQQRYYDPTIGRFLSMDPVTADANTGGNFNRYWYANNNPYRFIDPDGRQQRPANFNVSADDIARARAMPRWQEAERQTAELAQKLWPRGVTTEVTLTFAGNSGLFGSFNQLTFGSLSSANTLSTINPLDNFYISYVSNVGSTAFGNRSYFDEPNDGWIYGADISADLGLGLTNASTVPQLVSADGYTYQVSTPSGSVSYSKSSNDIWSAGVAGGIGEGASASKQRIKTIGKDSPSYTGE